MDVKYTVTKPKVWVDLDIERETINTKNVAGDYIADDGVVYVMPTDSLVGNVAVRKRAVMDIKSAMGMIEPGDLDSMQPIFKAALLYLSTCDKSIDTATVMSMSQQEIDDSMFYGQGKRLMQLWLTLSIGVCCNVLNFTDAHEQIAQSIVDYLAQQIEIRLTKHSSSDMLTIHQLANVELPEVLVKNLCRQSVKDAENVKNGEEISNSLKFPIFSDNDETSRPVIDPSVKA